MVSRRSLLTSASIYTGANIANAGIPFLLMPILTRVLTPADYGRVTMFAIAVTVFAAVTGLSAHGAINVRYFQLERHRMPAYVGACIAILAISTPLILLLVLAFHPWLEAVAELPTSWLLLAVVTAAGQFVITIRLSLWQVQHQAASYGAFQVAQSLLNGGLSLLLVLGAGMAWQGRALGQATAVGAFACLGLLMLYRRAEVSRPRTLHDARDALRFGVPLIPHVIGGLLIATTDRFMISNILDVSQAGIYMVALQLGMVLGLLTSAFNRSYTPYLMEALVQQDEARDRKIVRATYLYFVLVTLAAIGLGVAAPMVLSVLVGEQFRAAAGAVLYVAIGYAFDAMYSMLAAYVFYRSKTGHLAVTTLSAGLFNLVATYILIQANGLVGAAQAFMLSQAVLVLGTWWLAQRCRPMPWGRVFGLGSGPGGSTSG